MASPVKAQSAWLTLILIGALSGCAWLGDGLPREPGLYAVENGRLQRLDGDRDWERKTWTSRSNFTSDISFLIRDPRLDAPAADLDRIVRLHRVGWVRSEITRQGDILPATGNQWVDADLDELRVPVRLQRDAKNGEVVRAIPEQPLTPGLYTLRTQFQAAGTATRFGVGWPAVDQRSYAAGHCVDRYPDGPVRYRTCAEQQSAIASALLKVHLVKPELRDLPGQGRQLIVKGVVINTSDRRHRIPPLTAQLVTDRGIVVERWEFRADAPELPPGASASFESRLANPPAGATDVHVTLSPFDSRLDTTAATPW
ncbi:MAG: FxLYD domain-containing protein [Pseudomonadota bacterium]